jgi:hypothetical protein
MITNFTQRASTYLQREQNRTEMMKYIQIYFAMMELLKDSDVSQNEEFHKLYNVFYKLRFNGSNGHESGDIYAAYYGLLESHKRERQKPSIEQVLTEMWDLTGKVHLSFSSKLIGTLYPDSAPIWDNNVRVLLDIPYKVKMGEDRLALAAKAYRTLEERYATFMQTSEAEGVILAFDQALPAGAEVPSWKKIDFLLWRMGSRKNRNMV